MLIRKLYILLLFIGFGFGAAAQKSTATTQSKILRFYPNPASVAISFDFQRNYNNTYSLQIYNFMGKKVYDLKNTPSLIRIGLDDFYRGIYIFQLRDKNGQIIESGKFQVVK